MTGLLTVLSANSAGNYPVCCSSPGADSDDYAFDHADWADARIVSTP